MLPTTSSFDIAENPTDTAVLPVGSFEQHGRHLPLATDALVATVIAERIAQDHGLFRLPVIPIGCSHEHAAFPGTVSISAATLYAIVNDVVASLIRSGVGQLVVVNGHGGNYVLSNVVQEANANGLRMTLFPTSQDWDDARADAGLETTSHEDMHGGEGETSLLLHRFPDVVRAGFEHADHVADDRRHLLTQGISVYTRNGIIGRPSLASAAKGERLLTAFSRLCKDHLTVLRER